MSWPGSAARLQEADDVACDLARVLVGDPAAQACDQARSRCGGVGPRDGDAHAAVGRHLDRMRLDAFLTLHAHAIGHPELPVVPGTGEQLAVELTLGQAVALVGTGMVDGVEAALGAHDAHSVPVDLDHAHGADRDVGLERSPVSWASVVTGSFVIVMLVVLMGVDGKTSTMVEVKGSRTLSVGEVAATCRRRHLGAALLRGERPDPQRTQRRRAPALPRRRDAPGRLRQGRPTGRAEPRRDPLGARLAARRPHAEPPRLGEARRRRGNRSSTSASRCSSR